MSSTSSAPTSPMRQICAHARSSAISPDVVNGVCPVRRCTLLLEKRMAGLSLDLIALQLFAGLALGAIYVLFAIGLSLIFGMLTVVNFAHGAFYMVGAYAGVYILMLGGNFWICLIAVPLAVGLFGLVVERILIRPLYGRGIDYPLLLTFGLSYVMVELVRIAFGKTGYPFDTPEILQGAVNIGVGYFPLYRLFVIGATAVVLFAPEMAKVSIFALMAVVLIVRPQGFFGRAGLMS